jgi:hypothetical protein
MHVFSCDYVPEELRYVRENLTWDLSYSVFLVICFLSGAFKSACFSETLMHTRHTVSGEAEPLGPPRAAPLMFRLRQRHIVAASEPHPPLSPVCDGSDASFPAASHMYVEVETLDFHFLAALSYSFQVALTGQEVSKT